MLKVAALLGAWIPAPNEQLQSWRRRLQSMHLFRNCSANEHRVSMHQDSQVPMQSLLFIACCTGHGVPAPFVHHVLHRPWRACTVCSSRAAPAMACLHRLFIACCTGHGVPAISGPIPGPTFQSWAYKWIAPRTDLNHHVEMSHATRQGSHAAWGSISHWQATVLPLQALIQEAITQRACRLIEHHGHTECST